MARSHKLRIYEILESTDAEDKTAEAVNLFMLVLVVLNVAAVILETVESIYSAHKVLFYYFADISVIVFTIEYILRLWSCDVDPEYRRPFSGRLLSDSIGADRPSGNIADLCHTGFSH